MTPDIFNKYNSDFFHREEDGHTYYFSRADNEWICFPTYAHGEPDFSVMHYFSDLVMTEGDLKKLTAWLESKRKVV